MNTNQEIPKAWYNKKWLVIILCIIFFPVGLYALWKSDAFSKGWQIGITALIGVCIIINVSKQKTSAPISGNSIIMDMAREQQNVIANEVATDAVKQYDIAKRQGDKIEIYVHAGMVCAAYLQAKDEANYKKWKEIERQDAKNAGMPSKY